MADEYDDEEERRLRRLLGDYAPDEEQWFPPEGEPPYEQQGPPESYQQQGPPEPEPGTYQEAPSLRYGGRPVPLGTPPPGVREGGVPAPMGTPPPGLGERGGVPLLHDLPGFSSGSGDFREAAPPPFDPQAEVARMTAPPPPPIRVYAHTPGGLQEISQVEGSQGQPVGSAQAAQMLGAAGQALLAREQAIRADPQMSPADKSRELGHIHTIAGKLVEQSLIHGHGMPQQAMEGQYSTPQQQQLARLDAAEGQADQKLASGEWDVGTHHDVMEQIAAQRQAVKAKMVPKGPSMQEKFDADAVKLADGTVLHPTYHSNGTISGYKPIEPKHVEHLNTMLKQNPYDSPHDVALHVASLEAETRGLPAHPNLPPLHGPTGTGHGKGDASLGMAEKEWVAEKLKIVKSIDDRIRDGQKEKAAHPGFQPDLTPDMRDQAIDAELEKFGLKVQGYPGTHDWYAKHHQPGGFFNRTPPPGQGAPPGAPPPPQGAPAPETGRLSDPWFGQMYTKVGKDQDGENALLGLLQLKQKAKGNIMTLPPIERGAFLNYLESLRKFDPTLPAAADLRAKFGLPAKE